jgi:hypothetical protein
MESNRPTALLLGALGALALSGVAGGASARTLQSFTTHTHFSGDWSNIGCTQPPSPAPRARAAASESGGPA